jgi:diacylglycerol kinase (ATP)
MRAAAIFGLGSSPSDLRAFQKQSSVEWVIGLPGEREKVDAILVFGGDGTVHRHLGALVHLKAPVLVVPAGSGNDLARALGIRRVRHAMGAWKRWVSAAGNCRTIDLGLITPSGSSSDQQTARPVHFSCVAGVGLDGEISRRANALPRWLKGHGGYALSLPAAVAKFLPFAISLRDDAPSEGTNRSCRDQPVMAAVFANTPFYGGGMKVAPRARMDDGLLDVCMIRAMSRLKLLGMFPSVYLGRHLGIREVEYFPASALHVETDRPLGVYADGEYVCETPVEICAARNALRVIVP